MEKIKYTLILAKYSNWKESCGEVDDVCVCVVRVGVGVAAVVLKHLRFGSGHSILGVVNVVSSWGII